MASQKKYHLYFRVGAALLVFGFLLEWASLSFVMENFSLLDSSTQTTTWIIISLCGGLMTIVGLLMVLYEVISILERKT